LTAIDEGLKGVVIAEENAAEMLALREVAKLHDSDFQFLCFKTLEDVLFWLCEGHNPPQVQANVRNDLEYETLNFDDMYLDDNLKRMAVCFASGRHSLILRGTPGSGKSMFAQRLPSLIPKLNNATHLDALRIHSLTTNKISTAILQGNAPFRQPHHSTNPFALLGTADQPGEMSLAHGGVLFLDELPEFRKDFLEALREPLETGTLHISRAQKKLVWKSKVQLVAAHNNCPCGYLGSKRIECKCGSQKILSYEARLSGPLLERIDMHHKMLEMSPSLFSQSIPKQSAMMIRHVQTTREFMFNRWGRELENSQASFEEILESSLVRDQKRAKLMKDLEGFKISSRSILRLLRVARTLADMEQIPTLEDSHIKEAANLRP
ncbi:MAG: ATP-binding protein, partial [Proteobacteria bacterium]